MDEKHLSARLACVASLVPAGARVADIGSDHAYLPAALVLDGKIDFAIAGEVVKGPYENAVHEVKDHQLEGKVIPRLADGLAAIEPADKVDTITIAGMGGSLIASILEKDKNKLTGIKRLVLQPNVGESQLREWLMNNHYQIMTEKIIEEDNHIYEIIVAEPSVVPFRYSKYELDFGPFLLENKGPIFKKKWQEYLQREAHVIDQMQKAQQPPVKKINEINQFLSQVKEAIADDNR
ncbi:SAM-dependent methyltransferase [Limosilactobacillus reuteri]|uniref:SAM-dependent methyltransferase n=1 Tax=Limosilactobacillus reuteri TaxID=1598 RepID=A0A1C2GF75_LIMRT|nr:tRNA (adenine(22)-N(1))-methyltransferase TrmK [Limosilactobacillus reuteri]OCX50101.1 SAM-dependent methyltransferase [Limosilactobacillus reuteri]WPC94665.1 tRNA (adenine(22)-N(1))-methyltransferase TrmK [Limosilactobacillus reuteri]